jgi:hypothetical protein
MPLTARGTIELAVSEQALAGAAPLAHATKGLHRRLVNGIHPGLIQSPSQASLPRLSAWGEVGGIAPSLCPTAPLPQPIST